MLAVVGTDSIKVHRSKLLCYTAKIRLQIVVSLRKVAMRFNQLFIIALLLSSPWSVHALEPSEVMVIANSNVSDSVKLARYYMEQRGIPKENLISVETTSKETCSRNDFNEEIAGPIREFLYKRQGGKDVRCLVTMFGVPLKVDAPKLTKFEKQALQERREALADLQS